MKNSETRVRNISHECYGWDRMTLDTRSVNLLKQLSEAFGPSGFEHEPASIIKKVGEKYADEVSFDKLGSIIFLKNGMKKSPKVLLAGHMDEVGFVITGIDEKTGFLSFSPLGGWFEQALLGHRVTIRTRRGDVTGVIASKPPHLLTAEEREKVVKIDSMYIDVGASSGEIAEKEFGIRVGDPAAPSASFSIIERRHMAIGKAFDDRVGAFVGLEVLRRLKTEKISHPNTVYVAATVQEEVGLRGAETVAHVVGPDVAFALETDIAGDVPGIKPNEAPARTGKGPSILTFDASMIPNQGLKSFVIETAEKEKIPYQLSIVAKGGTDAGKFQLSRAGCPSIVISVPTRHIHSHSAILDLSDIDNAIRLMLAILKRLDEKTVQSFVKV